MFYLFDERTGNMSLVKTSPDKYELVSQFKVPDGGQGLTLQFVATINMYVTGIKFLFMI